MGDDFEPLPPADDDASAGSPAKSKSDRKEKKEKKSRSKSGKSRERTESTDSSKKSSHKSHKSKSRPDLSVDDDADVDHAPAGQGLTHMTIRSSSSSSSFSLHAVMAVMVDSVCGGGESVRTPLLD